MLNINNQSSKLKFFFDHLTYLMNSLISETVFQNFLLNSGKFGNSIISQMKCFD